MVLGVGMLFALSFDTVSRGTLFAVAGTGHGGVGPALALAACFIAGMQLTDGINGWWISKLVQRADEAAAVAGRRGHRDGCALKRPESATASSAGQGVSNRLTVSTILTS
jgi:hypothetical protein